MKSYNKLIIFSLAASALLMSCKESVPTNTSLAEAAANENVSYRINKEEWKQLDASNTLGLNILRDLVKDNPEKSNIVSPVGIRYCLSMAANGAEGATLKELQKAIGSENAVLDSVNALNRRMMIGQKKLSGGKEHGPASLTSVNTLENQGIEISGEYRSCLEDSYFAAVNDKWGLEKKATLRSKLIFKAYWGRCFDSGDGRFKTSSGDSIDVVMMDIDNEYAKLIGMSNKYCSAVQIPYDGNYCMTVVLPAEGTSISDFLKTFTIDSLKQVKHSLHKYDIINIHMPQFKTDVKTNLNESLADLGYGKMFAPGEANFSKMNDGGNPLYVDKMIQDLTIDVNIFGTTAEAMTNMEYMDLSKISYEEPTKLDFNANRPFFYAIYDNFGNICFCGVYTGK